jgi:hypothetical protein
MTTFSENKKRVFKLLLAAYFLVYSISPLTYTFLNKPVHEGIYATHNGSPGIINIHILLWESIIDSLSALEENPHSAGDVSILIKKKRALAPENATRKLSSYKNASMPQDFVDPLALAAVSINSRSDLFPVIYKGFNPVYAGHSPPTA